MKDSMWTTSKLKCVIKWREILTLKGTVNSYLWPHQIDWIFLNRQWIVVLIKHLQKKGTQTMYTKKYKKAPSWEERDRKSNKSELAENKHNLKIQLNAVWTTSQEELGKVKYNFILTQRVWDVKSIILTESSIRYFFKSLIRASRSSSDMLVSRGKLISAPLSWWIGRQTCIWL